MRGQGCHARIRIFPVSHFAVRYYELQQTPVSTLDRTFSIGPRYDAPYLNALHRRAPYV